MAIKPPPYCKDAQPTPIGWRNPRTREILAVRKISQAEIDEYYGIETETEETPVIVEILTEEVDLSKKTKKQLEELAIERGIELDSKETKKTLLAKLS